jgi:alkanesulfonate monooxygenase SsuD/methylene tetrahydromethanopterin reductase-like flavin-dependent oxidoreductase (luciferase family)
MDDIELGVLIPVGKAQWGPETEPRELLDFAVRAEELGYSSLWVNDSLLTPRIEALTMLAAVAPLTSRVTLGTAALLPVLRRPVQAAQTLASIDLLSGGRLVLTELRAAVGAAGADPGARGGTSGRGRGETARVRGGGRQAPGGADRDHDPGIAA